MYERFHKSGHNSNSTRYEQQPNESEKLGESKINVNYLVECFTFPSTEHTVSFETKSSIESKIILKTKISPFLFTHSRISLMLVVLFGVKMTMDPMKKRQAILYSGKQAWDAIELRGILVCTFQENIAHNFHNTYHMYHVAACGASPSVKNIKYRRVSVPICEKYQILCFLLLLRGILYSYLPMFPREL